MHTYINTYIQSYIPDIQIISKLVGATYWQHAEQQPFEGSSHRSYLGNTYIHTYIHAILILNYHAYLATRVSLRVASQITAQIGARTLLMGPALGLEVISYPYPHIHTVHTYIHTCLPFVNIVQLRICSSSNSNSWETSRQSGRMRERFA